MPKHTLHQNRRHVEFGVMILDLANASHQNYAEKLKARLKWVYKTAKENNDREAARHKEYYDLKFKGMKLAPGDLVLVRVKSLVPIIKLWIEGNKSHKECWYNTKTHLCIGYNPPPKGERRVFILCTEICCFHYNWLEMKKLQAKMMHLYGQIWP